MPYEPMFKAAFGEDWKQKNARRCVDVYHANSIMDIIREQESEENTTHAALL